jgi:hypothetical protein
MPPDDNVAAGKSLGRNSEATEEIAQPADTHEVREYGVRSFWMRPFKMKGSKPARSSKQSTFAAALTASGLR